MSRCLRSFRFHLSLRLPSLCKQLCLVGLFLCAALYILLRVKLFIDYRQAQIFYQQQDYDTCTRQANRSKLILFWTKIFSDPINVHEYNLYLSQRCRTDRCQVTNDRPRLCQSDAVIFHARGGIRMNDMPRERSTDQRYVLLTKEPPYKTTAIVGHLNHFFNWTATVCLSLRFSMHDSLVSLVPSGFRYRLSLFSLASKERE